MPLSGHSELTQQEGRMKSDRRDKAITYVCCRDFRLILLGSISLQKHLFKGR